MKMMDSTSANGVSGTKGCSLSTAAVSGAQGVSEARALLASALQILDEARLHSIAANVAHAIDRLEQHMLSFDD